ncbi:ROK family protein [Cryobacterium serini]|uniref:ROK family protein n=1 Tax=Cryobacterium serini TaxID=1259201 RepID=A0A4R9BJZ5_9MICO|nr:ROK family protein [Cryobacterium serini]TFD86054.1 ROK family protein [Cryobacterium serini]
MPPQRRRRPPESAASTGGRPSVRVALNACARVVAAAQFGASHATLALMDLSGEALISQRSQRDIASGPAESLDWVTDTIAALLEQTSHRSKDLIAIGIGLPGPVEHSTGRPTSPPIMPGWDGYDVPSHLQRAFDVPVLVDNDVNVMALGEQSKGWPEVRNLMFVKISTGIGAGIISAGSLQRGEDGSAGDIGHIAITRGAGIMCRCGNSGCLEAVAGIPVVMANLRATGIELSSVDQLIALAKTGDLSAMRAIRQAGRDVGEVLNMCVSIFNPSVIVVGGALSELSDQLIAGIREVVYSRFMPLATQNLTIAASRVGTNAGAIGAGIMAIEYALAPQQINKAQMSGASIS